MPFPLYVPSWPSFARQSRGCASFYHGLSDKVCFYIEHYRGENFSDKLENLVLDYEERQSKLNEECNLLQAHIRDKQNEMRTVQTKLEKLREVDRRVGPLVDAVVALLDLS